MPDQPYPDTYYRWNWFRRNQWWPGYRDRMLQVGGGRCAAVPQAIGDPTGKLVLDATCGLGRQTLVLSHLGLRVMGSDANAFAVEKARELATREGRQVPFFVAEWRALPEYTPHRFDAVYVDAFMDCCESYEDLVVSFSGIAGVLKKGGRFIYPGPEPGENLAQTLEQDWKACDPFYLEWQHTEGTCDCTCIHAKNKGLDYLDDHHLYLIREKDAETRLETATLRQWFRWDRNSLDEAARSGGFSDVRTQVFRGHDVGGGDFTRIIAEK